MITVHLSSGVLKLCLERIANQNVPIKLGHFIYQRIIKELMPMNLCEHEIGFFC